MTRRVLLAAAVLLLPAHRADPAPAGGVPVLGLTVALHTDDPVWVSGTVKRFEATLTNVGAAPFFVDVFGDLNEVHEGKRPSTAVLSCWALVWDGVASPPGPRRGRYTLSKEQFIGLAPGASHIHALSLALSGLAPGTYQVRLAYVPRAAGAAFSFPDRWQEQQDLQGPMWLGMAFSNPVTVTVTEPRAESHG